MGYSPWGCKESDMTEVTSHTRQLGRPPKLISLPTYITPSPLLPAGSRCQGVWLWGRPNLDLIQTADATPRAAAPSPHKDLPTEGEREDTEALWQHRGGSPQNLVSIPQVVTIPSVSLALPPTLPFCPDERQGRM